MSVKFVHILACAAALSVGAVSAYAQTSTTTTTKTMKSSTMHRNGGMHRGMASIADVSSLQEALNRNGAVLAVDGKFGAKTKAALVRYQTTHSLTPNGRPDKPTQDKLNLTLAGYDANGWVTTTTTTTTMVNPAPAPAVMAVAPAPAPAPAPRAVPNKDVMALQTALIGKGHKELVADGYWGDSTRKALMTFQEKSGMQVTGKPDKATAERLLIVLPAFDAQGNMIGSNARNASFTGTAPASTTTRSGTSRMVPGSRDPVDNSAPKSN